jgi:hypothetical protein
MSPEYQFMKAATFFLHIFEKVGVDALGCWPIISAAPPTFFNVVAKRCEQQH